MGTEHVEAMKTLWAHSGPRERVSARARAAVLEATPPPPLAPRLSLRPRRRGLSVALAVLAVGGAGALALTTPWDRGSAPQIPATREAAERIVADPLLSGLAWLTPVRAADGGPARIQELATAPSLRFPPGVGYEEATARIFESLAMSGTLPAEATLEDPLPAGKILALGEGPAQGIAIDLRAVRGYDVPSGVLPTGVSAAPGWSPEELERRLAEANAAGLVYPPGAVIPTPVLEPCQILDPADPTPPCRLSPPLP